MIDNPVHSFITGLTVGVLLTLTGGYFFGTSVLRKTLRECADNKSEEIDTIHHLTRAQKILENKDN